MDTQWALTGNSILLMQFRQFSSEVLRLKRLVEGGAVAVSGRNGHGASGTSGANPVLQEPRQETSSVLAGDESGKELLSQIQEVRQQLLDLLEQQSLRTIELGGSFGFGLYREAQYAMAALADETFLNAKWAGRAKWPLVEETLFQSHASGEIFFKRLDHLLAGGGAGSSDLAMVYFQVLALDFRGKYRLQDPARQIERYRRQLYMRVFQAAPEDASQHPLFLQSYETVGDEEDERRLPSPHMWWLVLGGVCAVWIVATSIVWHVLIQGIRQRIGNVQTYAQTLDKSTW